MTDFELLIDFHVNADRQGPGSREDSLKALSFINNDKNRTMKIADIGCGSGAQTIILAENLNVRITAVDLFPEFLDRLNQRAFQLNLSNIIETLEAPMEDLPFQEEEFDIIWSEGAIYNMGFENGINSWEKFLKKGGFIALSEITWTSAERPEEIEIHWKNEYPEIDLASSKIKILENNGFSPMGYFYLPVSSWIDNYYAPMEQRFDSFLNRHNYSEAAQKIVNNEIEEIRLYKKYKDFYSYGFYIAKKL